MEQTRKQNIHRTCILIITFGVVIGFLVTANYYLTHLIGFGAIFTWFILLLFMMLALMKAHSIFLGKEMTFKGSFLIGLPVFIISTIISYVITTYDFEGNITYIYYASSYLKRMFEQTLIQFIPLTLFFVLIFAPVYGLINKLRYTKQHHKH